MRDYAELLSRNRHLTSSWFSTTGKDISSKKNEFSPKATNLKTIL